MKKIFLISIIFLSVPSIYGQRFGSDRTIMEQQATISPTVEQIGITLFYETILDPIRLKDLRKCTDPKGELIGIEKIDPTFKVVLGYTSPWFLYNYIRITLGFEFFGKYLYEGNDLFGSGYKNTFNYQVIVGINISPYLYFEFDSRGRMLTVLSYTHRVQPSGYFVADIDTKIWLLGNGYDSDGNFARYFWEYSTINFTYFHTFNTSPIISSITMYSRFRVRFNGTSAYRVYTSMDSGELYGLENPNLGRLMNIALKTGVDFWFTPYVALNPYMEFFVDSFEVNSERFPLGLNLGVKILLLL